MANLFNGLRCGVWHGVVSACVVGIVMMGSVAVSAAAVEVEVQELRNFNVPPELDLGQAEISSDYEGITVLSATSGDGPTLSCSVVVAAHEGALGYEYQYNGQPTICVGVISKPDGGFFLRGMTQGDDEDEPMGFTAYIDASGQEVWSLHDEVLLDAKPVSEDGTGEFLGSYVQPHHSLAYSARFDRLLAFTLGELRIGMEAKTVTQAHVIGGSSGRLRVSGWTFGQSGVGVVAGAVTRASDGYFLLYFYSHGSQGAFFYSYNGAQNVSFFKPRGEDWDTRFVVPPLIYGPDDRLHLLWTPTDKQDTDTNITVVDDEAAEVWSSTWPAALTESGHTYELGAPRTMWVGADYTVVLYVDGDNELLLRVVDVDSGRHLGIVALSELVETTPIAILNGEEGNLKLLAYNESNAKLHEYRMYFTEIAEPDVPSDDEGDVGLSDVGVDDAGNHDDGANNENDASSDGCGCASTGKSDPVTPAVVLISVLAYGWISRRRR